MADAPAATGSKKSPLGFLGKKIGPVPIWLIAIALIAGYYWYENYGPGASSSSSSSADAIDPATGVPWSEELGEAQQQLADQQSEQAANPPTGTSSTPGPTPTPVTTPPPVTKTPGPKGPPPVSRVDRSPKVKKQIHQIHKEHVASEKKAPAKKPPANRPGPVRKKNAGVATPRAAAAPKAPADATRWRAA